MDINEIILTDEALNAIDTGIWVDDIDDAPGLRLLVVGLTSKEAQDSIKNKQATARLKNRGKPLATDQLAKTMRETLAEVVLKGWDGLTSGGVAVEYSKQKATEWIMSRNGEKFANIVLQAAQKVDDNANEFVKEATKN